MLKRTNRQTVASLEQPSFHTAEALKIVERVKGIEPSLSAWEANNGGGDEMWVVPNYSEVSRRRAKAAQGVSEGALTLSRADAPEASHISP